MKRLLVVFCALFAMSAHADVAGSIDFVLSGANAPALSELGVNDLGNQLVGVGGSQVYLQKQNNGYQGNAFGRFFNMTCSNGVCVDHGATQLNIKVKQIAGGYTLDGTLNFVSVHATVTDSAIALSADGFNTNVDFTLNSGRDGTYSGEGAFGADPFDANLSTYGTLAGLKDPATFIVLIVNPFVRN